MCKDDIDLEEIVRNNKEKIEEILRSFEGGGASFKIDLGPLDKVGDAMKGMFSMFFDPRTQMHFVRAGKELFAGIEEMIKNAPLPDEMRETVNKAREMKDSIINNFTGAKEEDPKPKGKEKEKEKGKEMKKIDVE
jgi:hypothetical protein